MSTLDYSRVVKWIISREIPPWYEGANDIEKMIDKYKKEAQEKTDSILRIRKDYQKKTEEQRLRFTPYIVTYMVEIARTFCRENPIYAELVMNSYKTKFNVDINPYTNLPKRYGIGHTSGIVVGGIEECGENIFINHGVTIGRFKRDQPMIGKNVLLMPHCIVVGKTKIGDGSVISAGIRLVNQEIPPQSLVVAVSQTGKPVIKEKKDNYLSEYIRVQGE
ncbi:hypothetical protein FZZ91_01245 [Synechococcus sp. HB1133]|uniref:hypothetical protein n=1 Tax=unclassified Synechococcus TaxID=2626047 RepID=UPI001407D45A|nr:MULTISPECIES: hypothetical protein [unclassified Synechococcus]MCB4421462.1 hypothetical protein [Synechococcus sp. HB1133]MCB4431187.1 hypothetical protein [Synechococcus sp. HBA1120]NHI80404.1 hypothetical protein [Synechococcus sp. HB1133]